MKYTDEQQAEKAQALIKTAHNRASARLREIHERQYREIVAEERDALFREAELPREEV
jgi:hypothetical protein